MTSNVDVITPVTTLLSTVIGILPNLVAATITLFFGLVFGWMLGKITKNILLKLELDKKLKLPRRGIFSPTEMVPVVISWIIYLVAIQQGFEQLEMAVLQQYVGSIIGVIVNLVKATIVVIVGYVLAGYISVRIKESKVLYSEVIAKVVFLLIVYVTVALALPFVGLDTTLINAILLVIVFSIGLGMAIALGLGLKDTVARMARRYERKMKY